MLSTGWRWRGPLGPHPWGLIGEHCSILHLTVCIWIKFFKFSLANSLSLSSKWTRSLTFSHYLSQTCSIYLIKTQSHFFLLLQNHQGVYFCPISLSLHLPWTLSVSLSNSLSLPPCLSFILSIPLWFSLSPSLSIFHVFSASSRLSISYYEVRHYHPCLLCTYHTETLRNIVRGLSVPLARRGCLQNMSGNMLQEAVYRTNLIPGVSWYDSVGEGREEETKAEMVWEINPSEQKCVIYAVR